jgi:hypothetical protein
MGRGTTLFQILAEKLTYFTNGRRFRLTDVKGKVIQEVVG